MIFVANEKSSPVAVPADGAFDFPVMTIAAKRSVILKWRSCLIRTMWCDLFDATRAKCLTQPVGIGSFVLKQSLWTNVCGSDLIECFDRMNFSKLCRDGDTLAFGHSHQLGAFFLLVVPTSRSAFGEFADRLNFLQAKRCRHPLPATS